ncbi:hypothetical protein TanjilG_09028 [Lupinus angustifolius]|uniref:Uncharacterized protein n=1 Tax=Lupinus angustifolius TaxID=3871 RepID=A0A4P1QPG3_LUPAN|nr:PREDICTED: uncharacterized protein LOC109333825 [Lupinus angustifolius]OIV91616.1 hypothetical protein TanjilG_09028 [Lupinus angustifolius]
MSYYNSSYSASDYGEYNFNSCPISYHHSQTPYFMLYNDYEYNQQNYVYDPNLNYAPSTPSQSCYQTISSCYGTNFSDSKSIKYDPNYDMTSELVIYYNKLEFNEPAFEEYDPTPYGGGYDMAETYGKPLSPSDKICYPRSGSSSIKPPFDSIPVESIVPLPIVEEGFDKKEHIPQKVAEEEKKMEVEDKSNGTHDVKPYEDEDSDKNPHEEDYASGSEVDEYNEKKVAPQYVPSGYGLEAMDICETLFGYWPCLARMKREQQCYEEVYDRGNNYMYDNMWKGAADYLFGNQDSYGGGIREDRNSSNSYEGDIVVYGYERHYPT